MFEKIIGINSWIWERHKLIDSRVQQTSKKIKLITFRYIIVKLLKIKDLKKSWKQPEEYNILYLENKNSHDYRFSSGTVKERRQWNNIFKVLKEKNCQLRILFPVKTYLRNEGKIKKYSDEGNLRIVTSRTGLKEMLMKVVHAKARWPERNLEFREKGTKMLNIWVNISRFFFLLKSLK